MIILPSSTDGNQTTMTMQVYIDDHWNPMVGIAASAIVQNRQGANSKTAGPPFITIKTTAWQSLALLITMVCDQEVRFYFFMHPILFLHMTVNTIAEVPVMVDGSTANITVYGLIPGQTLQIQEFRKRAHQSVQSLFFISVILLGPQFNLHFIPR